VLERARVGLHAGTLVAVLVYFRTEIVRLLKALRASLGRRTIAGSDERLAWAIVAGTIPAVIAGGLGQSFIEDHLGEPWQISILLSLLAAALNWPVSERPVARLQAQAA